MKIFGREFFSPSTGIIYTYFFLFFFSIYIGIISYWPFEILTVNGIKVIQPITVGGQMYYEVDLIKHRKATGKVTRKIMNGEIITFPVVESNSAVGKQLQIGFPLELPHYISPGMYVLVWEIDYELNFPFITRTIHYEYTTQPFYIGSHTSHSKNNLLKK